MKRILIVSFFVFISSISAQEKSLSDLIIKKLDTFSNRDYQEKVFIHTDKDDYQLGDDIWFTAYLLNASNHLKSNKSFNLYAELIDEKDSILSKNKIYMKDLSAASDFRIPQKIKPGKYIIRGYTNYMRNEGTKSFFTKEIRIWDKVIKREQQIIEKNDSLVFNPDVHFYPEGGYLVNNLKSMVAVKIKNPVFDTLKTSIQIIDDSNNVVTSFTSTKFGLGLFSITPEKDKTYKAVLKFKGSDFTFTLPRVLSSGEVLNTIQNDKELIIRLNSNQDKGISGSTIALHQRGNLIYTNTFKENSKTKNLKIPLQSIPNGVVHITLLNSENKPTAERLVFINNPKNEVNVNITKPKEFYGNRRKVDVEIDIKNSENQDIASVFSLTVKDVKSDKFSLKENIKTWLLLNSDLKGKIEDPNYYFENPSDRKRKYLLDLVMMTNGWRRFKWQSLLDKTPIKKEYDVERGFVISGRTYDMKRPNGPIPAVTRLTFLGRTIEQEPLKKANHLGEFNYGPFVYFDSLPAVIEARKKSFKSTRNRERKVLIIKNNAEPSPKVFRDTTKYFNYQKSLEALTDYQKFLSNYEDLIRESDYVLDEVTISGKLKRDYEKRKNEMDERTSYGASLRRFDVENQVATRATAIELFYSVPGINVIRDSIYIRSTPNVSPLILFDEMPIDVADLINIDASEISFIDLLIGEEASVFTSNGSVVSIYSKSGNANPFNSTVERKPGIIDFRAIGFYTGREYYATDPVNDMEMQFKEDPRTTLHWEPKLETNNKEPIKLSFFTSDFDSQYVIEIQGITRSGIPFYQTKLFTVD